MLSKRNSLLIISLIAGIFAGLFLLVNAAITILVFSGLALVYLVISFSAAAEDRRHLSRIFSVGFFTRFSFALLFYFISVAAGGDGFLMGDDGIDASYNGWEIAKQWQLGQFPKDTNVLRQICPSKRIGPYHFWNAFIYYFIGWNPLFMFSANCLIGAISIILLYLIAKALFNRRCAVITSWLFAFWPSVFLWSSMNSKEPTTIFCLLLAIWSFMNLRKRITLKFMLAMLLSLVILFKLRVVVFVVLLFSLSLSLFLYFMFKVIRERNPTLRSMTVIGLIAVLLIAGVNFQRVERYLAAKLGCLPGESIFQGISYAHNARTYEARTAFFADVDISSPLRLLVFLPFSLSIVLLAPFPWPISSAAQAFAVPEMLIWYLLLPFAYRGLIFAVKYRMRQALTVILFVLTMWTTLALVEGNAGTLFRHRTFITGFCLMFAAAGLIAKKDEYITGQYTH